MFIWLKSIFSSSFALSFTQQQQYGCNYFDLYYSFWISRTHCWEERERKEKVDNFPKQIIIANGDNTIVIVIELASTSSCYNYISQQVNYFL